MWPPTPRRWLTPRWYGGEWNPGGVSAGSVWYNFVPPVSGSTIIASSGAVGEYLALYPGPNTSGYITYGWGPFQLNLNGGTPYWLQVGLASYGLEGVSLTIVGPPPNDNWANAINVNFVTNALVTSSPDGPVTNYTCTASFVGQNYLATRDAGEYDIANYTGVATKGRSVWWTITAPANGYITIDPTKSSFITELGLRPESVGVGGSYGGYWVVNNGKIVNAYLSAGTRYKLCVDGSSQDTGLGMGGINLDITFVPCPPNDNWAGPTPVTLQTNVLTGTVPDGVTLYTNYTGSVASHNIGATYEGGEYPINNYSSQGAPGAPCGSASRPPPAGISRSTPPRARFRTQIGIKAPGQVVSYSWGGPNAYAVNSTLTYYVNAGSSYMICVDGTSSDAGYGIINLDFKLDASPGNDYWASPTPIIFQTNIATISMPNGTATNTYYTAYGIGNNLAATYEGGEYPINNYSSQGAPGRSVWFTFTAPFTGTLTIDPTRSTFRTQIGIKAPGQAVSSGWGGPNAYAVNSILSYGVTAGNTYMVCVDGTSSDAGYGFIDLALQINAIPYNDVFPGAMLAFATNAVLETVAEFTVTNLLYTATAVSANNYALQDSGEYSLCSQYSAPCLGRTIWWSFNPPVQSYATISLAGSTFDTLLAGGVFNGVNNGKSWYNDDANGLVTSAATVLVYPGQTNRIVVDGKSGATSGSVGGVNLTVSLGAPANDFYANAQVLTPQSDFSAGNMTGISIRVPGSTTYASNQGENWAGNNWLAVPPNKNVWFSYTATNSGTICLTVESAANHLVAVYSGSSFNSGWIGGSVGVQGASPNAACTFTAAAGTTYKICVDGTVPGPFVLNLKHYGTTAPLNDNFVNRLPLTNGITHRRHPGGFDARVQRALLSRRQRQRLVQFRGGLHGTTGGGHTGQRQRHHHCRLHDQQRSRPGQQPDLSGRQQRRRRQNLQPHLVPRDGGQGVRDRGGLEQRHAAGLRPHTASHLLGVCRGRSRHRDLPGIGDRVPHHTGRRKHLLQPQRRSLPALHQRPHPHPDQPGLRGRHQRDIHQNRRRQQLERRVHFRGDDRGRRLRGVRGHG